MFNQTFRFNKPLIIALFSILLTGGCTVEAARNEKETAAKNLPAAALPTANAAKTLSTEALINIEPNSPADTVRVFYRNLREKKFREAFFLTNLRPAIESLTDAELKELHVDFEPLARQIPAEIEINGEIISKNTATVTAKMPDNETDELKIQQIKLRRANNVWIILTVDETAEVEVRREGANYFTALKIKTHQQEAKAMLERVNKAQMVYAMKNGGLYGDAATLTDAGFLPKDFLTAETTGYNYHIQLSGDRKKYAAAAIPAVYGRTGKLSFWFEADGGKVSVLRNKDTKGQPLKM